MKDWIIRTFGLKGSWKWAKKQMMNGKIVRCKHWSGTLKLKIDSKENTLLKSTFNKTQELHSHQQFIWETSNHFLNYENFTDYVVFTGWATAVSTAKRAAKIIPRRVS